MKKKIVVLPTEGDLSVDLTFHNFPASLLTEFTEKNPPYYLGNISEALKILIRNAIKEEDFILSHVKHAQSGDYG